MSKFGLPCAIILANVILIIFNLKIYVVSEKNMLPILSCIINVTMTSQNGVPSFLINQRAYVVVLVTPKIIVF